MESVFDTRGAVFEPEHVSTLIAAYKDAIARSGPIPRNTERQLGKLVVNMARRKIDIGDEIDAKALAKDAVGFIAQLRSTQWLL